jgi:hypothetical protein
MHYFEEINDITSRISQSTQSPLHPKTTPPMVIDNIYKKRDSNMMKNSIIEAVPELFPTISRMNFALIILPGGAHGSRDFHFHSLTH